jgi:hypothetical protein
MVLPEYHAMSQENATSCVLPWEIGFVSLKASEYFEVDADFSEICFFYDRGAVPSMAEGPVRVNIFAQFVAGQDELRALCYRMRREGWKRFTVRRVESE